MTLQQQPLRAPAPDSPQAFPVDPLLDEISSHLEQHHSLLLTAEPGAGKTTRVPLHLLQQTWLNGQTIVMLEPRRVAARNAAQFMAQQLGEAVGQTVGYRLRLDNRESDTTRLLIVTEGILTRMLQQDPELHGVGLIIFDEFHERHLNSDLGLALAHQCQQVWRDNLRLLVMSATLDTDSLSQALQAPVLHCPGRSYPVDTCYRPKQRPDETLTQQLSRVIHEASQTCRGHLLVFLPGVADIQRLQQHLADRSPEHWLVLPLHGQLSDQQQKQALADVARPLRKIILATNIAESSLTINGVDCVIDSGLERRQSYNPATGVSRLETRDICRASAIQREGRAGRQGPGYCYRLWSESTHHTRAEHISAEITRSDLTPLLLELRQWGADADELVWLDQPPAAAMAAAAALLVHLGYFTDAHDLELTPIGQRAASSGMEPRWAIAAADCNTQQQQQQCTAISALLQEWPHQQRRGDDIERWLQNASQHGLWQQRILPLARRWQSALSLPNQQPGNSEHMSPAQHALRAFPDRLAQKRPDVRGQSGRYQLANGIGAELAEQSALSGKDYLVVVELSGGQQNRIRSAIAIEPQEIETMLVRNPHWITESTVIDWQTNGKLLAERQYRIGALIWQREPLQQLTANDWHSAWLNYFRHPSRGLQRLQALNWCSQTNNLRQRVALAKEHADGAPHHWPDWSEEALLATVEDWLLPHLTNCRNEQQLQKLALLPLLQSMLDWPQQQWLEQQVPARWTAPGGSSIAIDYSQQPPVLAVKLQEMFGEPVQPAVLQGRVPLLLHLLSPGRKPLQVTRDLAHFWRNAYTDVRKEMRGRYPKHPWPEDPLSAEATRLTKRALARQSPPN